MALTELDRRLITRCIDREPGAWNDFVDRYVGLFLHVAKHTAHARSVPLGDTDAEDLVNDVFVVLLDDNMAVLRRFAGKCSLATYLTVIARRVIVRQVARRRRTEGLGLSAAESVMVPSQEAEKRIEDQETVTRLLTGLSERDAKIVRQFHMEGRSYREISQSLSLPESSVGSTLSRARRQLELIELAKTG